MIPSSLAFSLLPLYLYSLFFLFPPLNVAAGVLVLAAESWSFFFFLFFTFFCYRLTLQFQLFQLLTIILVAHPSMYLAQINLLNPGTEYIPSLLTFPVDSSTYTCIFNKCKCYWIIFLHGNSFQFYALYPENGYLLSTI